MRVWPLNSSHHFPALRHDRTVWLRIIQTVPEAAAASIHNLLEDYAPPALLADAEIMGRAADRCERALALADAALLADRQFLERLPPTAIQYVPHNVLGQFPDLVRHILVLLGQQQRQEETADGLAVGLVASYIAPLLTEDHELALHWFASGLPFVETNAQRSRGPFPLSWRDDREIFLRIAKHCHPDDARRSSFSKASDALRGDKEFMLQVLKLDPRLFYCAAANLKEDDDLALLFFADNSDIIRTYLLVEVRLRRTYVEAFRSRIQDKLREHRAFCGTFLPGMTLDSGSTTALCRLNQGTETSLNHKQLIAAYLGVPTGKYLGQLRRALGNIDDGMARLGRGVNRSHRVE